MSRIQLGIEPTQTLMARTVLTPQASVLYAVESGVVRVLTWNCQGDPLTLNLCGPGDWFGLPFSHTPYYQAECLTRVHVRPLPQHLGVDHLPALLGYSQQVQALLAILHQRTVPQRLSGLLRWLDRRFGRETDNGRLIDVPLSHRHLAEILGTTRVTITRLLNRYQSQHLLCRSCRRMVILNRDLLLEP